MSKKSQSLNEILAERGANYGKFESHASITQQLKRVMRWHQDSNFSNLPNDDMIESLEMIAHKIGRIINIGGNSEHIDSWDDIAGYAKLVADRLRGDFEKLSVTSK